MNTIEKMLYSQLLNVDTLKEIANDSPLNLAVAVMRLVRENSVVLASR